MPGADGHGGQGIEPARPKARKRRRPRRKIVTALLCYLVLHPGSPRRAEQLLAALWPIDAERKEASRASLHSYLSMLRSCLGADLLPDAATTGYVLGPGVATDWAELQDLMEEAQDAGPQEGARLRTHALALVRGVPFGGTTAPSMEWAYTEHHVAAMEVAISGCAHALARWYLDRADGIGAVEAARSGLRGVPDDARLWADLLLGASLTGDAGALRRAWRDASRALGPDEAARLAEGLHGPPDAHW